MKLPPGCVQTIWNKKHSSWMCLTGSGSSSAKCSPYPQATSQSSSQALTRPPSSSLQSQTFRFFQLVLHLRFIAQKHPCLSQHPGIRTLQTGRSGTYRIIRSGHKFPWPLTLLLGWLMHSALTGQAEKCTLFHHLYCLLRFCRRSKTHQIYHWWPARNWFGRIYWYISTVSSKQVSSARLALTHTLYYDKWSTF